MAARLSSLTIEEFSDLFLAAMHFFGMRSRIMEGLKLLRNLHKPGLTETKAKKHKGKFPNTQMRLK